MSNPFDTDSWKEASKSFQEGIKAIEESQEKYWDSLSQDQQLDVFCCIMRRLAQGELDERRTYRGILYDVFNWGPEAYMPAQVSGFLDIHNAIYSYEEKVDLIKKFCEKGMDITKDNLEEQIREFVLKREYY